MNNLIKVGLAVVVFGGLVLVASSYEERPHVTPTAEPSEVSPTQAPKIVAVAADHDFGKVKQGKVVEHTFKIKNEGASDLIIRSAKGS
jgi:hypothetical protein